ncbi:hypothetical protein [Streptomyces scabiei]|uniref:hypothetical protein n=1 Tax=Streptomyces scabiei TaxID=1930 RepID=UPI0007661270|nr:hypothetical protein [Streptomyces scabiei]MBP5930436.1 hypothetical protein [Streptomyces sp. LBUM 1479]
MSLTRAELPDHLGRWVTVTNPDPRLAPAASWYGRLVALADDPTVVIQAPGGGGQGVFPQAFVITPADPPEPGAVSPRRQAAYDAVYAYINGLGTALPPDPVHRNAMIWRAVTWALDAANIPAQADPDDPTPVSSSSPVPPPGMTVQHSVIPPGDSPGDAVPAPGDAGDQTVPASGGHVRTTVPDEGQGRDLTSGVPARPHPGHSGDEDTDRRPEGVRFAYSARVRRDQVHEAITEAFGLLDAELHPRHPALEEDSREA